MFTKGMACLLALCLSSAAGVTSTALPTQPLRINELMASNHTSLEDAFGRAPDWIELYNPTDAPVSLKGFFLSDKRDEPERYAFPEDAVVEAGGYVIVFASGAKKDIADEFHTSFKLSAAGEGVYLNKEGQMIDGVFFGPQESDIAYALDTDGQFKQTSTPTPGAANVITPVKADDE